MREGMLLEFDRMSKHDVLSAFRNDPEWGAPWFGLDRECEILEAVQESPFWRDGARSADFVSREEQLVLSIGWMNDRDWPGSKRPPSGDPASVPGRGATSYAAYARSFGRMMDRYVSGSTGWSSEYSRHAAVLLVCDTSLYEHTLVRKDRSLPVPKVHVSRGPGGNFSAGLCIGRIRCEPYYLVDYDGRMDAHGISESAGEYHPFLDWKFMRRVAEARLDFVIIWRPYAKDGGFSMPRTICAAASAIDLQSCRVMR